MSSHPSRLYVAAGCAAAALLAVAGAAPSGHAAPPAFVTAPLPQVTGVTYAAGVTHNEDVEPGIGVDPAGEIWVGSNIDPNTTGDPRALAALSGEDIWRSSDGGRTFQWVADPFNASSSMPALGGEDSDLAVAQERNSSGHYNVYATSLYLAASNVAISQDGGATWTTMALGGIPAQDRPWLSTDGPCVFYLTYHQLPLFAPVVNKYDVCNPADVGMGLTLNPVSSTQVFTSNTVPGLTNAFNKPFVDNSATSPFRHNIYVPMEACDLEQPQDYLNNVITTAEQVPNCPPGVVTQVEVAVSTDGGQTFTDQVVAHNSNGETQVWPTSVGIDSAGAVYLAWSDNLHGFLSRSSDGGTTWSKPVQLGSAPVSTISYPTVAAGAPGHVVVGFYGTGRAGDSNDKKALGAPGDPSSALWHLYWQESTDGARTLEPAVQVSGVNHTGVLCTMGSGCAADGSRNLYDDFGVVINPVTSLTTVAFDSDQPLTPGPAAKPLDPFTAYATELGSTAPRAGSAPAAAPAGTSTGSAVLGLANTGASPAGHGAEAAALAVLAGAGAGLRRRRIRRARG